jgi:hypothetical protein
MTPSPILMKRKRRAARDAGFLKKVSRFTLSTPRSDQPPRRQLDRMRVG